MTQNPRRSGAPAANDAITVTLELGPEQAMALAQFVKRVGWMEWRQNAVSDDEAYLMKSGFNQLQRALADAGYAPH